VLDKLNLAAADNRVFARNKEMQALLQDFKQIFKDLVNGVPTAYNDLDNLFKSRDKQLQELYDSLPSFIRKLVKQLPDKMAPEVLATLAARADASGVNLENAAKAAAAAGKAGFNKDMFTKPAAVAGLLRTIVAFLRARFPALMGMSVLWSLALCSKHTPPFLFSQGRPFKLTRSALKKSFCLCFGTAISEAAKFDLTGRSPKQETLLRIANLISQLLTRLRSRTRSAAPDNDINSPPTVAPTEPSPSQGPPAGKSDSALQA
jgi:hypothetical protein